MATLASLLVMVAPAQAATPSAPTGLTPSGETVDGIPTLSWARSPGATVYDVQVSPSSSFGSSVSGYTTVNRQLVPDLQVPLGLDYYRVRARNNSGSSDWTTQSFIRGNVAAPTLQSPANNTSLKEPDNAPVLTWSPVPGTTSYNVQVSTDGTFADQSAITSYNTRVSSFVVPTLRVPTDYYWRVQAVLGNNGLTTPWATPSKYTLTGLSAPTLQGPPDDGAGNLPGVQDVVLDWNPVPGAATYDLQVSTDSNFNTISDQRFGIEGTKYSPPVTLNNDQYYWRVRPVDAAGNNLDWGAVTTWHFRRNWPDQPSLQYPANNATVGDTFYYQWSPVPHASSYILQVSSLADFSDPDRILSCSTVDTTLAPFHNAGSAPRNCMPTDNGTYWWRVEAVDAPASPRVLSDVISLPPYKFTYSAPSVPLSSPANGTSLSVPTMRWQSVAGAAQYRVTWTDTANGSAGTDTTAALSYTPRAPLVVGDTYRWQVQTITGDGRVSASLLLGGQRTFTVIAQPNATASTPDPTNTPTSTRFSTLTWSAVTNASSYKLYVRPNGGSGYTLVNGVFTYPAGEDTTAQFLTPGNYDWIVEAYQGNTLLGTSSTVGSFTISPWAGVLNGRAAITGNAITGNAGTTVDSCAATLPSTCQNLRQEPVLMWDKDPNVAFYKLYFSFDGEMTNLVPNYGPIFVYGNMWTDTSALPDSQAGSAFYWEAVPCRANGACAPLQHAQYAFNKLSNKIVLHPAVANSTGTCGSPSDVCNDVTLSWDDYLATEQNPGTQSADTVLTTPATTGPMYYRVQTSTDPNFQSFIDDILVDQTTLTSFNHTYPEGPIYWRVQAYDEANNALAFSPTPAVTQQNPCPPSWCFVKKSPAPHQDTPPAGATQTGTQSFAWDPQKFARSYELEVYRNNDTIGQPANLAISANGLVQAAYSPTEQLAASTTPYTWRVRRRDAENRTGPWSPLTPFTVTGTPPTLVGPGPGADVAPSDGIFSWGAVDQAASYRFERRVAGSSTISETVNTPALAYAPTQLIDGGNWQWRVTAIDANGQVTASSAWRDFSVTDHPVATTPVTIAGSGAVGTALTVQAPGWNIPNVTTTYQWMRGTSALGGETGNLYTVTTQDVGQAITVVATGNADGYRSGTSTSNAVTGGAGNAPSPTVLPSITGAHKVGSTVVADPGTWPGQAQFKFQWLRGGSPIQGATASTYLLGIADATRQISVKVSATVPGYAPGTATSKPINVGKMLSSTTMGLAVNPISRKTHAKMTVTIAVPNVLKPSGTFKVYDGKKVLMTVKLKGKNHGVKTVTLPLLHKGTHKLRVKYLGKTTVAASKSAVTKLIVTG